MDKIKNLINKLLYKNDKKTGEKRLSKLKIGLWIFLFLLVIGSMGERVTSISVEENYIELDKNTTNYTIKGEAEANSIVTLSSEDLGINNVTLKLDENNRFSYVVSIPKNDNNVKVYVTAKVENKSEGGGYIEFVRKEADETSDNMGHDGEYYTIVKYRYNIPFDYNNVKNVYRVADSDPLSKEDYFKRIIMIDCTEYYLEDKDAKKMAELSNQGYPIYLDYWEIKTKDGETNKRLVLSVKNYDMSDDSINDTTIRDNIKAS